MDETASWSWIRPLLPPRLEAEARVQGKARLLILFYLITTLFLLGFAVLYAVINYSLGIWATLYGAAVVPLLLFVFHKTASFQFTNTVYNFNALAMFAMLIYGTGGIHSCILPWLTIIPATAYVFNGWRRGLITTLICLLLILGFFIMEASGFIFPIMYDLHQATLLQVTVVLGLMAYSSLIIFFYQYSRERTIAQLDEVNADLKERQEEVEVQRQALATSNANIAQANAHLEQVVARRTERLAKAKLELDTFLYEAAHALRRPVARIMGLSSILRGQAADNPASIVLHDHMDTSTALLDQILHKLVMVSEIDGRKLQTQPTDLQALLFQLVEERQAKVADQDMQWTIDASQSITIEADPVLVTLVLEPILENAVRYTAKTGRVPAINITLTQSEGEAILTLRDNGLGIAASELPRIREMFFRATEKVTGGGLGLYVAQRALERLHGHMDISSTLGEGTQVTIHLPLTPSHTPDSDN